MKMIGRFSIFGKLSAQTTSSKFQFPSCKEAPSSKLKNRPARRWPRHLFLGFGVLRFGTSLELGVWSLVFRSAAAHKLRCDPKTIQPNRDEIFGASPVGLSCTSDPTDSRPACRER